MDNSHKIDKTTQGTLALVFGIISIVLPIPILGIIFGTLAIVFAYKQNKKLRAGTATAGLALGIIGVIEGIFILIILLGIVIFYITPFPQITEHGKGVATIPNSISVTAPFSAISSTADSSLNYMGLELRNNGGEDLAIKSITVVGIIANDHVRCEFTGPMIIPSGETNYFRLEDDPNEANHSCRFVLGELFNGDIEIIYRRNREVLDLTSTGIVTTVAR